jgi:hypothetical protein
VVSVGDAEFIGLPIAMPVIGRCAVGSKKKVDVAVIQGAKPIPLVRKDSVNLVTTMRKPVVAPVLDGIVASS